jgi:N-acetylmuramoyl-L-alanine amidase
MRHRTRITVSVFRHMPAAFLLLALLMFIACKKDKSNGTIRANNRMLVVLDPAHGGTDSGAVDQDKTMIEKEQVLSMCNKMKQLVDEYNIEILMTRTTDNNPSGDERLAIANATNVTLFLSLHIRKYAAADTATNTFETIVSTANLKYADSKKLATAIISVLSQIGLQTLYTERDVYVLKNNQHPAVTIECGNIDKAANRAMLKDEQQMEALCRNLLSSIVAFGNGN